MRPRDLFDTLARILSNRIKDDEMESRSSTSKLKRVLTGLSDLAAKRNRAQDQVSVEISESLPKKISQRHLVIDEKEELGEGAYGTVYKGKYQNKQVAIKQVDREPDEDVDFKSDQIAIMKELSKLGAPHVIQLYAYTSTVLPYYLVMPLMQNGSLEAHIEDLAKDPLSASLRFKILIGVAKALAFMHQYLLIHCDIKAENVLLDKDFEPYLADFDSAVKLDPNTKALQMGQVGRRGTLMYMAPEILRRDAYTTASDVYAFSILMWEVMAWKWYGEETQALPTFKVEKKVVEGYRQKTPENCPETIAALIQFGWHADKSQRPGMPKIKEELEVEQERLSIKLKS